MTTYIISLGQIFNTKTNKTVNKFVDTLSKTGHWFPTIRTYWAYLCGTVMGTISFHNSGKLNWNNFKEKMCSYSMLTMTDQEFEVCWNAMCELDSKDIDSFKGIIQKASEGEKFIIASNTNGKQFEYIRTQLSDKGVEINSDGITLVCSFEKQNNDFKFLVQEGVKNINKNGKQRIVSLHSKIQTSQDIKLAENEVQFQYVADIKGGKNDIINKISRSNNNTSLTNEQMQPLLVEQSQQQEAISPRWVKNVDEQRARTQSSSGQVL